MNLLFAALRNAIDEAAKARGLEDYRVVWKHNSAGDFVMAVVTNDSRLRPEKLEKARDRSLAKPRRD